MKLTLYCSSLEKTIKVEKQIQYMKRKYNLQNLQKNTNTKANSF